MPGVCSAARVTPERLATTRTVGTRLEQGTEVRLRGLLVPELKVSEPRGTHTPLKCKTIGV
eukprot:scaffold245205_cov18-Prasinocladus_malaysianus.AAC.1